MLAASEADTTIWGPVIASFSMYPLLVRDGLALAYLAANVLYVVVMTAILPSKGVRAVTVHNRKAALLAASACVGAVCLHLLELAVPPPEQYPWLYDRAFITYSFWFFAAAMAYMNYQQWHQSGQQGKVKPS